jgi:hypothetical protein
MQLFCGILWNFLDLVTASALEWLNSIVMWKGLSDERQPGWKDPLVEPERSRGIQWSL